MTQPKTAIARSDANDVYIRGRSLCGELIGKVGFTELMYLHITGRSATPGQVAVLDACLVTLMEHGLTPSARAKPLRQCAAVRATSLGLESRPASVAARSPAFRGDR